MARWLLAAAGVTLCATLAHAQSLAEAARRAEEARKIAGTPTLAFDMRDVDPVLARQELLGIQIDERAWARLLEADRSVARTLKSDAAALQRFHALEVSSVRAFERFIHREKSFAAALSASGVQPRDYAGTHLAIVLALQESRGTVGSIDALPPAVKANVAFVRSKDREIKMLATPAVRLVLRIIAPPPPAAPPVPAIAGSTPLTPAHPPAASPPPASGDGPIDLQPGSEIPDFRFVDFNGNSRNLADFRGKYLMLDFWGSWCGPCRAEIPHAREAYARFRSRGFEILGMDYEHGASFEDVRAYLNEHGVGWTFARPDSVRSLITERFRVKSFPTIVLLDPDGRVMPVRESSLRGKALAATLDRILPR